MPKKLQSGNASAAIVGSGPNGLAAAVTLARAGIDVTVFESHETIGGGTRSAQTVQEGVMHDVCSAIHPTALATKFFDEFELTKRVDFVVPEASYANPLDGTASETGQAAIAYRDLSRTADELGRDGRAYKNFFEPLVRNIDSVTEMAFGGNLLKWPSDLRASIALALRTLEQGSTAWNLRFKEQAAPALITGAAAHSIGRMPKLATSAVGVVLAAYGHAAGWPVPVGGSQSIADVMAQDLVAHGGQVRTNVTITDIRELDDYGVVLFDTSARALEKIAGARLPDRYRRKLRAFKYGDGVAKVDFVLDGPVPWHDERVHEAPSVHLGGSRLETSFSEAEVARGRHPQNPYVLLAQPDRFDVGRNPADRHAIWSYTHVPKGSTVDMQECVTAQIERFAPDFRDRILAVKSSTASELGDYNPNYIGGDISSGAISLKQLLARPTAGFEPWRTPTPGIYLCSSSAPPGPGVHGLSGWYAALAALKHEYGLPAPYLGLD